MKRISLAILLLAAAGACRSESDRRQSERASNPTAPGNPAAETAGGAANVTVAGPTMRLGDLASCQPTAEVKSAVTRLLELADTDGNGQISREEARASSNFLLGGLFFRADENADGKITPEEGRKTRTELQSQFPTMGALLQKVRQSTGKGPFQALAQVLNVDSRSTITVDEARKATRSAIDDLYEIVDSDKNGTISRQEAVTAAWEAVGSMGKQAFAAADTDQDAHLSGAEFDAAVASSARAVFNLADANKDGRLSESEAVTAMNTAAQHVGLTQPQPNR